MDDLTLTGFESNQELPGRIVVQEALEPFNKKDPQREIKRAGKTGVILMLEGKAIYRRTIYTNKQATEDVIVKHDNKKELQEAYAKQKATEESSQKSASAVNSNNSEFDLDITD